MEKDYDLCWGRDGEGRLWRTAVPAGIARTGSFVRLVGGRFIRISRIVHGGRGEGLRVCAAAEVLERVWEVGGDD